MQTQTTTLINEHLNLNNLMMFKQLFQDYSAHQTKYSTVMEQLLLVMKSIRQFLDMDPAFYGLREIGRAKYGIYHISSVKFFRGRRVEQLGYRVGRIYQLGTDLNKVKHRNQDEFRLRQIRNNYLLDVQLKQLFKVTSDNIELTAVQVEQVEQIIQFINYTWMLR